MCRGEGLERRAEQPAAAQIVGGRGFRDPSPFRVSGRALRLVVFQLQVILPPAATGRAVHLFC